MKKEPNEAPRECGCLLQFSQEVLGNFKILGRIPQLERWQKNMNWFTRLLGLDPHPINNCTPRVQRSLVLTRKIADDYLHRYVDSEHILLGMLALGEGVGLCALLRQGVDLERLKKDIESQMIADPKSERPEMIPYRPSVMKILHKYANAEAGKLGHDYLGTEHVLLGILRLRTGIAYESLHKQSVGLSASRIAIIKCLKPNLDEQKNAE
jgi:ATP-dependent Clp protease ATP-binding subunit ClpC